MQSHPALHATEQPVVAPAVAPANTVATPAKKSPYPFTPTFSRATPVASPTGASQQRAFAGPLVSQAAPVAAAAVATPAVTPVVEAAQPAQPVAEPENEPGFDIENFELELSDAALKLDLADLGPTEPVAAAPAAVPQAAVQPVAETVAPQREPERSVETFAAPAPAEQQDAQPESALPFDPSMIAEAENGVAPIADMEVPQLPVIETEKPVAYPADYDLDIDAEMAQLFGTPAPAVKDARPAAVEKAEAVRPAQPQMQVRRSVPARSMISTNSKRRWRRTSAAP